MRKISEAEVIFDAYTSKLPEGEAWYEERLRLCAGCEYNSKNMKDGELWKRMTLWEKAKKAVNDAAHLGLDYCTLCLCPIKQKCGSEHVACALEESGIGKARWNRRKVITSRADDFNLINASPEMCNVNLDENQNEFEILYNLIDGSVADHVTSSFILEHNPIAPIRGIEVKPTCGCTVSETRQHTDNQYLVRIQLNTGGFHNGWFRKVLIVDYLRDSQPRQLLIALKGIVKNSKFGDMPTTTSPPAPSPQERGE
jgi:hypothetical protein